MEVYDFSESRHAYAYVKIIISENAIAVTYSDPDMLRLIFKMPNTSAYNYFRMKIDPFQEFKDYRPILISEHIWFLVFNKIYEWTFTAKERKIVFNPTELKLLKAPFVSLNYEELEHRCEGCNSVYSIDQFCASCTFMFEEFAKYSHFVCDWVEMFNSFSDHLDYGKAYEIEFVETQIDSTRRNLHIQFWYDDWYTVDLSDSHGLPFESRLRNFIRGFTGSNKNVRFEYRAFEEPLTYYRTQRHNGGEYYRYRYDLPRFNIKVYCQRRIVFCESSFLFYT